MSPVRANLLGERFGRLTVLEFHGHRNNKVTWRCICDCGNEKITKSQSLVSGKTRSCGCYKLEINRKPRGIAWLNTIYRHYSSAAEKRGYEFSLNLEQLKNLILSDCHYCGSPPSNLYKVDSSRPFYGKFAYNGIDRKNNHVGYTLDNCVTCCKTCNLGKHTQEYEEFISYLDRVKNYRLALENLK